KATDTCLTPGAPDIQADKKQPAELVTPRLSDDSCGLDAIRPHRSLRLQCLDLDVAEVHAPRVCLQADETRRAGSSRFAAIGIGVDEVRDLLAVERDGVSLALHANLKLVPTPHGLHRQRARILRPGDV